MRRRTHLLLRSLETRLAPATMTVSNTADSGVGSLRQAIIDANTAAGADTIVFDTVGAFSGNATISLSGGQISITGPLDVVGTGSGKLTVRNTKAASTTSRVFDVTATGAVNISGMLISGGNLSGGVRGAGIQVGASQLKLTDVTVDKNTTTDRGGGICIAGAGTLTLINSKVTNNTATGSNAGGIWLSFNVPLTMDGTTVSGNSAASSAGGIYFSSGGALSVVNCTISQNKTTSPAAIGGAGIYFFGNAFSPFMISNSTISGNTTSGAGGGIRLSQFTGNLLVQNSTFTGNTANQVGGGIARTAGGGTLTLKSSIVAGNTCISGPDLSFNAATNVDGNNNLVGVADSGSFTLTGTGNLTGTLIAPLDAKLGALANNGGLTFSHMPAADSPVLEVGFNAAGSTNDQRGSGYPRIVGTAVGIGSVEAISAIPFAVATASDVTTNGGTGYTFTVTYKDNPGINVSTLGNADITVTGPSGPMTVSFVSVDIASNGTP